MFSSGSWRHVLYCFPRSWVIRTWMYVQSYLACSRFMNGMFGKIISPSSTSKLPASLKYGKDGHWIFEKGASVLDNAKGKKRVQLDMTLNIGARNYANFGKWSSATSCKLTSIIIINSVKPPVDSSFSVAISPRAYTYCHLERSPRAGAAHRQTIHVPK